MLADHGAEVIKIEPPQGDETRGWGPPFSGDTASYFIGLNRNKRTMALDLATEQGRAILLRLLESADVLVENFKIGTMERWGIGSEVLRVRYPGLVHCRISGFGADGPLGALPGYDAVLQAMSGIMSVNGEAGGDALRVGIPLVDMVTGLHAAIGILLALQTRHTTGRGQFVEAALYDTGLSLMHPHAANFFLSGAPPKRTGNAHPNITPYSVYKTRTQPIFLAVGNDVQFGKLCRIIEMEDLATDPSFRCNAHRLVNRRSLDEKLERALAAFDGPELAHRLIQTGVPAGPILSLDEALTHPHTAHRNMVVELEGYRGLGTPVKLSDSPATLRSPPRAFGADTRALLREAGFSPAEIDALAETGVIAEPEDR
jgi:crotonobetainyl-CoA:carnitine CoA-transferase CaiB-like acyl-CoA transferase